MEPRSCGCLGLKFELGLRSERHCMMHARVKARADPKLQPDASLWQHRKEAMLGVRDPWMQPTIRIAVQAHQQVPVAMLPSFWLHHCPFASCASLAIRLYHVPMRITCHTPLPRATHATGHLAQALASPEGPLLFATPRQGTHEECSWGSRTRGHARPLCSKHTTLRAT